MIHTIVSCTVTNPTKIPSGMSGCYQKPTNYNCF